MILKGYQRGNAAQLAKHLTNMRDNEHVDLHELRGFMTEDELHKPLKEAEAIANARGIQRAETALEDFTRRAKAAQSATELGTIKADYRGQIAGLKAEQSAQLDAAKAADSHGRALDTLATRWDPLRAASKRYERSLAEIQTLERSGIYSAEAAGRARQRAAAQLNDGAVAVGKYGQSLKVNQFAVTNFNAQIQDIIVSAPNQSLFTVLTQQGLQLSSVFNQLGTRAAIMTTMRSAFGMLLNPMTLAALAFTGLAAGAVQWAPSSRGAEDAAKDMEAEAEKLAGTLDALGNNSQATAAQIEQYLRRAFGSVSGEVQALIEDLRRAEFSVISNEMQKAIEGSTKQLTGLSGAFQIFWADFANPGSVDSGYLRQMEEIISKAGIAYGDFLNLESAVAKVFTAKDVDSFVSNLSQARALAAEIGGPVGDQVGAALLKAAEDSGVLNRVLASANSETVDWASNLTLVTSEMEAIKRTLANIGGGMISNAAKESELAALQAGKSVKDAALAGARTRKEAEFQERWNESDVIGRAALGIERAYWEDELKLDAQIDAAREAARKGARSGGSGGRSAGLDDEKRASDQLTESIRKRLASLQEEGSVQTLLREGRYQTAEAARLAAEAMALNGGQIDATTAAMIRQIDAQGQLNEKLRNAETSSITSATATSVEQGLQQGLSSALKGDTTANFARQLSDSVRGSVADALSKQIVAKLGIDQLFNLGATAASVQMQTAIAAGGTAAAAQIATAMQVGSASASASAAAATGGGSGGG